MGFFYDTTQRRVWEVIDTSYVQNDVVERVESSGGVVCKRSRERHVGAESSYFAPKASGILSTV